MLKIETEVIHAGQSADPLTGAVMTPIYQTSTYRQESVGTNQGYEYSRSGNPTRTALENCLATLENGAHGLAFSSGMAAIDAVVHLLEPGDHILAANDLYGGTYRLFERVYAQYGLAFSYGRAVDSESFVGAMRPETRLIWLETPSNPLLELCDISAIAEAAKSANDAVIIGVDNTFATPYLQRPLDLGADIVQHSTTKYLGGHSDVIGGALVTSDEGIAERLRFLQNSIGAVPSAFDCFLVLRGIKTLAVRMDRHWENARKVAAFLAEHPAVNRVYFPGLSSHPQFDLGERQMRNGGGMLSFSLESGADAAVKVAESTAIFTLAESLGGVESLIEVPAAMTHASTADSPMAVDPGLVRLSIGLENADDLVDDLRQALSA